ncbi:hypothetical protein [Pedobacter borealis]|uniref:hypothetical protein n=1 Tax=Pedobacter borealis TaxID=475254 RepID=UPI00049329D9|nr:hypothetical protein [Pedobacter borealis]
MAVEFDNKYDNPVEIYVYDTGTEKNQGYDGEYIPLAAHEKYTYEASGDYITIDTRTSTGQTKTSISISSDWGTWNPP